MNRLRKAKIKKLKRAALITANNKGFRAGYECYTPDSGATNGMGTNDRLAYKSGYDEGLSALSSDAYQLAFNADTLKL